MYIALSRCGSQLKAELPVPWKHNLKLAMEAEYLLIGMKHACLGSTRFPVTQLTRHALCRPPRGDIFWCHKLLFKQNFSYQLGSP